ncbi:rCG49743, isoform CRA_a, partial [Rattus norvegicus]
MKSWQLIAVVGDALQDIKADCSNCVETEDRKV